MTVTITRSSTTAMITTIVTPMTITAITIHDHGHDHGHDAGHVHDEHCGHSHGPTPAELAGPGGWRRGSSAILTVGIRPCSGAILVLVFALAQGLFWAGIAATFVMGLGTAITVAAIALVAVSARGVAERLSAARDGGGMLIMRGLEFAAAGAGAAVRARTAVRLCRGRAGDVPSERRECDPSS